MIAEMLHAAPFRYTAGCACGLFIFLCQCFFAGFQCFDDLIDIVDSTSPCTAADILQGSPETGIIGQIVVFVDGRVRFPFGQDFGAFFIGQFMVFRTDEVQAAFEVYRTEQM